MTSKDYLSQEEIDALLRNSGEDSVPPNETEAPKSEEIDITKYLSELEVDALGEIGNITFGSAATALSTLLRCKVDITTPVIKLLEKKNLESEFPKPHVAVHVHYVEGFEGINSLVIKTSDASVIADLMLGGDGTNVSEELSDIHISAVQEAMNQMMGSSATSMSTIFNRLVNISPPGIGILNAMNGEGNDMLPVDDLLVKISFRLKIGDLIDSMIMQLFTIPFAKKMVDSLMSSAMQETSTPAATPQPPEPVVQTGTNNMNTTPVMQPSEEQVGGGYPMSQQSNPNIPQQAYMQTTSHVQPGQLYANPEVAATYSAAPSRPVNVQPVQFADFSHQTSVHADETNMNLLLDIPLRVTVELGRTHKQIKDILELAQGSIIELDKLAGEPVDILVNNKLIAKGEVVVIDENFGVRVTDIVNHLDRISKLQ